MNPIKAMLEGGQVERLHATPHLQRYTVARHSWGMGVMLLALYPGRPSLRLLAACLTHDIAERWVGDIPATTKWNVAPGVREPLKQAEQRIEHLLGITYQHHLTEHEERWLKALDLAELWTYTKDELTMGNSMMLNIEHVCRAILLEETWVPNEIRCWVKGTHANGWERSDDSFGACGGGPTDTV